MPLLLLQSAGVAILLAAALHDLGFRTVPNRASAALFAIGLALRAFQGNLAAGLAAALAILLLTSLCWRAGWMGGGDVKLLTASAIFVPPHLVPLLLIGTAIAGGALALLYLFAGRIAPRPATARPATRLRRALRCELWRLRRRGPLPYAAAIACGGMLCVTL